MIKLLGKAFCWIHDIETENEPDKTFHSLCNVIKDEFKIMTLREINDKYDDINVYATMNKIHVYHSFSYEPEINYILKNIPEATISDREDLFDRIEIKFSNSSYRQWQDKLSVCEINNRVLPKLSKIQSKLSNNSNESYKMLLNKYDSIFHTLITTIEEMKETTGIGEEEKQTITEILSTFIEEFESLEALFNKRLELDQQAIKDSLKRRLDDELMLVNQIKTNWNNELGELILETSCILQTNE